MKRSELKDIIKEAMMEILPDLMEIMVENMMTEGYAPQSVQQKPDLTLVRQRFTQGASGGGGYDDMPDAPKTHVPMPPNPKTVIEGEPFASGKGIMEWFGKTATAPKMTEFNHSEDQMEDFMQKKFGVK